jgi:anthranilate/para-aminobenzoate synthase component II
LHPLILDKIIIVDFEDSFTYNIANILFPFENKCRVVSHLDFFKQTDNDCRDLKNMAIILGPGPGHPEEYLKYFSKIEALIFNKNIYLMGICLGHQLIGLIQGYDILPAKSMIHGGAVSIFFQNEKIFVQRYNSLAVYKNKKELFINKFANGVSYQFHPESIGTHSNLLFFKDLLTFIS